VYRLLDVSIANIHTVGKQDLRRIFSRLSTTIIRTTCKIAILQNMVGKYYTDEETKHLKLFEHDLVIYPGEKFRIPVPKEESQTEEQLYMVSIATKKIFRRSGVIFAPYVMEIFVRQQASVDHVDIKIDVSKGKVESANI
jgi:hypothetical protein